MTILTKNQIRRVAEIHKLQRQLEEELISIHPFLGLNGMKNKAFGEWSEDYVIQNTPNILKGRGTGTDLISPVLGKIEVKSTRSPQDFTFNQIKPEYSDYHLFVLYDTVNIDVSLSLVPNNILGKDIKINKQHNYKGEGNCYTVGSTVKTKAELDKYRISFEELNGKA